MKKIIALFSMFLFLNTTMQCPPKCTKCHPSREQREERAARLEKESEGAAFGCLMLCGGLGATMMCIIGCAEYLNPRSSRFNVEGQFPSPRKKMD